MNLLLIRPDELDSERNFTISGDRAEHIRTVLRAKPGDSVKTGFIGGMTGAATLLNLEKEKAVLHAETFDVPPPEPLPLSLVVSLPRPQSFKKTLHFAVSAGIRRIVFIHSVRVEKSYWNSTVLHPESLDAEIHEALEQGFDTIWPEISFYRHFGDFLNASDSIFPADSIKLIAHPGELFHLDACQKKHIVLAIGPEGGFVRSEIEAFAEAGFAPAGFGGHILRVEFAAAFITGFLAGGR